MKKTNLYLYQAICCLIVSIYKIRVKILPIMDFFARTYAKVQDACGTNETQASKTNTFFNVV